MCVSKTKQGLEKRMRRDTEKEQSETRKKGKEINGKKRGGER